MPPDAGRVRPASRASRTTTAMTPDNEQRLSHLPLPQTNSGRVVSAPPDLDACSATCTATPPAQLPGFAFRDASAHDLRPRNSSASFHSRSSDVSHASGQSALSADRKIRRRGYVRPQGTDFAASARCRESVMSLGSIAHLQYYFARTGLLDGKGAQLARKRHDQPANSDLSYLGSPVASRKCSGSDVDSTYASLGSSPDLGADARNMGLGLLSPHLDAQDEDSDEDPAEAASCMLPPTVSTYHHRDLHLHKPPTLVSLKAELEASLAKAAEALEEVRQRNAGTHRPSPVSHLANMPEENTQQWYELQGMNMLDLVTLAIRAAKMYYTAHELPDRLDAIKPEKQVRADLLAVMDVLKQMATRQFRGGLKDDEISAIGAWIDGVFGILRREAEIAASESAERAGWTWLRGDWSGRARERERLFLLSMDHHHADALPEWTPVATASHLPTPFLLVLRDGLRLIQLHNAAVKKSRRRFGAIPDFHVDTQKPYRCAENLRYWVKAAELRFDLVLKIDVLGIVYDSGHQAWQDFDSAIFAWCRHVRSEIASELLAHEENS